MYLLKRGHLACIKTITLPVSCISMHSYKSLHNFKKLKIHLPFDSTLPFGQHFHTCDCRVHNGNLIYSTIKI